MTVRVEPTNGSAVEREVSAKRLAIAARHGDTDWIVPSDRDVNATRDGELANGPLGAFARIDGDNTNLSAQFDTGEAFAEGSYFVSDDNTAAEHTVSLPASSTTLIYVGYDLSAADTLIIGEAADFGTFDPKLELWEFTTDGSSITSDTDKRPLGKGGGGGENVIAETTDTDDTTPLSLDTGTISTTYPVYTIVIQREAASGNTSDTYLNCRLNGISSADYYYGFVDGRFDELDSAEAQSEFGRIAGTHLGSSDDGGTALQTIRVGLPDPVGPASENSPKIWTPDPGVDEDLKYIYSGHLLVDSSDISRINLFGGGNATGRIKIYGETPF